MVSSLVLNFAGKMARQPSHREQHSCRAYNADKRWEPTNMGLLTTRTEPAEPLWDVHRQDDNGNHFVMESGLSRAAAERILAEFEARHHKQTYWLSLTPR
jgi:hypothetical protein